MLTEFFVQLAEGDFARQAQLTAAQLARQAQAAGKSASDGFTRFVEGNDGPQNPPMEDNRKAFWDSFSSIGDEQSAARQATQAPSAIGTSAMGMGKRTGGGAQPPTQKAEDGWDDW